MDGVSDELLRRIQARPGLRDAAVAVPRPIVDGFVNLGFDIVGNPPVSAGSSRTADYVSVSPNYFRVMGIPLMAGRLFERARYSFRAARFVDQRGDGTALFSESRSGGQEAHIWISS